MKKRILPFEVDYILLEKCRKCGDFLLWSTSIMSIIIPIIKFIVNEKFIAIIESVEFLYMIMIVGYFAMNMYTEVFLYPATARKRRKGFIDNSLGSKYLEKPVKGYYSNDKISKGPYKILVNCGENCYFTKNIAEKMMAQIVLKNVVLSVIFFGIAYWGMKDNLVAIPIAQILMSSLFLSELIHHINFVSKLQILFEEFKMAFEIKEDEKILHTAIFLFLEYETTLAYNKAPLSDKIYKENNEKWTKEWEGIKKRYDVC